jgi:hypothetical protein
LLQLKGLGLEGLEVYSSIHTPQQTQFFKSLAKRHKLLISGGSDYHGIVKPDIQLGRGKGNLEIPYRLVAAMKEARLASGLWITTKPR